jgi:hypothetical protein
MLLAVAATLSITIASCKKENNGTERFSSITDSAGNDVMTLTFDNNNRVIKATAGTTIYDFYYNGDMLIKRTTTMSGLLNAVDSFFYDGSNRFAKVVSYDDNGSKQKETVLSYNGNNTVNQATINSNTWDPDQLFKFTYNGTNLNKVTESEKQAGTFRKKREFEFLAFDANQNPIASLIKESFPDQYNLLIFLWMSDNNFTSAKQTDYSLINGDVTGTFPITATYNYNGLGLPTTITTTINGTTNTNSYHYTTLK